MGEGDCARGTEDIVVEVEGKIEGGPKGPGVERQFKKVGMPRGVQDIRERQGPRRRNSTRTHGGARHTSTLRHVGAEVGPIVEVIDSFDENVVKVGRSGGRESHGAGSPSGITRSEEPKQAASRLF